MNIAAVIICLAALVCFLIEFVQTKSLAALGLTLFVAGFILTFVIQGGSAWVIH